MNRFRVLRWRHLFGATFVFVLAASTGACGQVRHGEAGGERGGEAGTDAAQAGTAAGGAAGAAGQVSAFGGGLTLGGSLNLGGEGTMAVDPRLPVPLADTQQCNNEFVRVEQLPDTPLFMTAVIDGEPTEVQAGADDDSLPTVSVFRFGSRHVENVGFAFFLTPHAYSASINISAVNCGIYGNLSEESMPPYFSIELADFRSTTYSVDGYEGITVGVMRAEWRNDADADARHVLEADFALDALMPDARKLD